MTQTVQQPGPKHNDFYISYHSKDKKWAKWINWCLQDEGYTTSLRHWGIQSGRNILDEKDEAAQEATYILAVLSPDYLNALHPSSNWVEVFGRKKLLPIMVRFCDLDGLFGPSDYIDLVGVDENTAYERLSKATRSWSARQSDLFTSSRHDNNPSEQAVYNKPDYPGRIITGPSGSTTFTGSPRTATSGSGPALWQSPYSYYEPDNDIPHPLESEPLLTDPRTIYQREETVNGIYEKLIKDDTTAIALTGIGGVGKSIIASLIYRKAEDQRKTNRGPFATKPIWLEINEEVTMIDLAGNLFKAVDKRYQNFPKRYPLEQARILIDALNSADKPLLIILDQFDKILDWQTGRILVDRQGVGQWLDRLNGQTCKCKVLFTSRPYPKGIRDDPPTFLREHLIGGLSEKEGVELLKLLKVRGTDDELSKAVKLCDGLSLALTLLAAVLKNRRLSLTQLLQDPDLWIGNVAENLLNYIYKNQLSKEQRMLLSAFAIYRKDVLFEAAEAILRDELQSGTLRKSAIDKALDVLLIQHLLQATEGGRYRLHAIVVSYALSHFDASSDQANQQAKRVAHAKAALYYRMKHQQGKDTDCLVEAIWHYCQAELWQTAFILLDKESIYAEIKHWGGNSTLLQLYKLLLPLDRWRPKPFPAAHIHSTLGDLYYASGQKEFALDSYKEALDIFNDLDEPGEKAEILKKLGAVYEDIGKKEEAQKCYEEALGIFRKAGDREGEGVTLYSLGRVLKTLGNKEEARKCLELALDIFKNSGGYLTDAWLLKLLGEISYELGKKEDAQQHFDNALIIFEQEGDREGEGETLNNLGLLYLALGKAEDAENYLERALTVHRGIGNREMEGVTLSNMGRVYNMQGKKQEALDLSNQALRIHEETGNRGGEGITLNNLGVIYDDLGEEAKALEYYKRALNSLRDVGKPWEEGRTLYNIGTLYTKRPDYKKPENCAIALAFFLLARSLFGKVQSPDRDMAQGRIDYLAKEVGKKIGKKEFAKLLARVESNTQQIVEEALRNV